MGISIAVLDTGVTEEYRKYVKYAMMVDDTYVVRRQEKHTESFFAHGILCLAIIRKYFKEAELSSIQILDERGRGTVEKLAPAFEWCLEHGIAIVNVSFGTTNFRDRDYLLRLVDSYSARGLIIIGASANSGYTTYPASFPSVIGVAAGTGMEETGQEQIQDWDKDFASHCLKCGNIHTGVDILAPGIHRVEIGGSQTTTVQSNSYAAPFVTAWAGVLLKMYPNMRTDWLREKMLSAIPGIAPFSIGEPVREKEEVPVVVFSVTGTEDVSDFLRQICLFFREDGYHALTLSRDRKEILWRLGFQNGDIPDREIPAEGLEEFLREEIYFKKCDILLVMSDREYLEEEEGWKQAADIHLDTEDFCGKNGGDVRRCYVEILGRLAGPENCQPFAEEGEVVDE